MQASKCTTGAATLSSHHIVVRSAIVVQEPVQRACAQVRHLIVNAMQSNGGASVLATAYHLAGAARPTTSPSGRATSRTGARPRPPLVPAASGRPFRVPSPRRLHPASHSLPCGLWLVTLRQRRLLGGTCASSGTAHLLVSASKSAALLILAGEPQAGSRRAVRLEEAALKVPPQHLRPHPFEEFMWLVESPDALHWQHGSSSGTPKKRQYGYDCAAQRRAVGWHATPVCGCEAFHVWCPALHPAPARRGRTQVSCNSDTPCALWRSCCLDFCQHVCSRSHWLFPASCMPHRLWSITSAVKIGESVAGY